MAKKYLSIKAKSLLPLPAKPTFKQNEKMKEGVKFFQYWENLTPEVAQLARVRVYRMKPPIDLTKIGERVKSIQVWEGPIPFGSETYEKFFYEANWAGGGDYRCAIEEIGLSGNACEVFFSLTDWDTYPPKVADASLMTESNAGQEYVKWRARRGEPIQGAEPEPPTGEDDFMELGNGTGKAAPASTAAVLVGGLVDMAQSQIQVAQDDAKRAKDEAREAREHSAASPGVASPAAAAMNGAIDLALSSASKVVDSVMAHAGARYDPPDPLNMAKGLLELIPKPDTTMVTLLMQSLESANQRVAQMQNDQLMAVRAELTAIRSAPQTAVAKSAIDQLREARESAELLGYTRGADSAPAAPAKSVMEEWGPIIQMGLQIVTPLIGLLTQKLQSGAPTANPQPTATVTQQPQPQQPPPDTPQSRQIAFLKRIEGPFMAHLLSPDTDGFTFANHVLTSGNGGSMETQDGRAMYREIKTNLGLRADNTCGLDQLIRTYEPMWNRIEGDLKGYQKFLTEFFNYDEQAGITQ